MEITIPCRNCDHPLKSGSCLGCNVFRLYEALQRGKLDWAKDEYNGIVESKLENPTVSPDDVRGVAEWIDMADFEQCSVCNGTQLKEFQSKYGKTIWIRTPYCPNCGARMKGD